MYIAVDVGATKTLIALLDETGTIVKHEKYPTDKQFPEFSADLNKVIYDSFITDEVIGIGVGAPGQVNYQTGDGLMFGNLPWQNVPLAKNLEDEFHLPVVVDNDANLAGLAEARSLDEPAETVVYVTVSTGVGTGIITNNQINKHFARSEGGFMHFDIGGQLTAWEDFAAGSAIKEKYGKLAADIPAGDPAWQDIAYNIALGLSNIAALIPPEVIILGGGVGSHLPKFKNELDQAMAKLKERMFAIPTIVQAKHPEEAVIYGCYHALKELSRG